MESGQIQTCPPFFVSYLSSNFQIHEYDNQLKTQQTNSVPNYIIPNLVSFCVTGICYLPTSYDAPNYRITILLTSLQITVLQISAKNCNHHHYHNNLCHQLHVLTENVF